MWGAHLGCNIELEFFTKWHDFITEFDCHLSALFLNLLSENWIHKRIKDFSCVFENDWVAILNGCLEDVDNVVLFHVRLDSFEVIFALMFLFKPQISLHLRVDHQGPSFTIFKYDSILDANFVTWETLTSPLRDSDLVTKNFFQTNIC